MLNPYSWVGPALCALSACIIIIAPTYCIARRCFPSFESKSLLRKRIKQLEDNLGDAKHESVMLNNRLLEAVEANHVFGNMRDQMDCLQERLSDVESRHATAMKEIEFWRSKDDVAAAADIYYTLCLDYKDEIARFGSVIAWVDHLKSMHDYVKPLAGMIHHDEN